MTAPTPADLAAILDEARYESDLRYTLRSAAKAFVEGAQFALAAATREPPAPLTDSFVQTVPESLALHLRAPPAAAQGGQPGAMFPTGQVPGKPMGPLTQCDGEDSYE